MSDRRKFELKTGLAWGLLTGVMVALVQSLRGAAWTLAAVRPLGLIEEIIVNCIVFSILGIFFGRALWRGLYGTDGPGSRSKKRGT